MLPKIFQFLILIVFISLSCNENKRKSTTSNYKDNKESIQKFKVSFLSYGTGIDFVQKGILDSLIKTQKNNCKLEVQILPWGREGELDYCFTGADEKCITEMYTNIMSNLKINERVELLKNKGCENGH